jgi:lipopolysaccharide biosynthesis regulator YciM
MAAGRTKTALAEAWDAANASLRVGDDESLAAMRALALEITGAAAGRTRKRAETLHAFCAHSLTDARDATRRGSVLEQLLGRRAREATKACPACGDRAAARASYCPSCGFRFPGKEV